MRILYLDCSSGISGDMFLGALLDAGADFGRLKERLQALAIDGFSLRERKVIKAGVKATKLDVMLNDEGAHVHRKYSEIIKIIKKSGLSRKEKEDALGVFSIIAGAESKVHNRPVSEIEFHEVGGLDSIADIVGASVLMNQLKFSKIYCSPLNVGGGKHAFHGKTHSVPGPAVRRIIKSVPHYSLGKGELTTPTGASIAKYFCRFGQPQMRIISEGFGAGDADFLHPNVLRAVIGEG